VKEDKRGGYGEDIPAGSWHRLVWRALSEILNDKDY
jgi:hypothetical protein